MSFSIACGSNDRAYERGASLKPLARFLSALFFLLCGAASAQAQVAALSSSYITPFPQGDRYQVRVIGDWLGAGLTSGLQDAFKNDASVEIADISRSGFGLIRAEQSGLSGEVDKMLSGPPVHAVVIMLGANDRASLKSATGRAQPGSEEWKELYGKEAERVIKKLRNANIAVYWVGLPPMGSPGFNDFAGTYNDTVRQAVYASGAKFIESSAGFTDQQGAYSAWGTDISGQTKRLREGDGIGMTPAGYRKLASFIEVSLRRDLAQARAQRNIPLAGDEEEQARVVPAGPRGAPKNPASAWKPDSGTAKTDPGKTAEGKPELPPAQIAARRDQAAFAESGGQQGEFILGELGNGLTSIAVISPVTDLSIREIQRQTPLADRLYFKVLSKGDALPAKEGRADDFRWRGDEAGQSQ
ncbi:MAG: GDSL-type esterase/lipase family protein [Rhodomicrobium sp.]